MFMKPFSQTPSLQPSDAAMYSAIVDAVATVCCNCDDQETGLPASVYTHPVLDFPD